jgi:cysteine desulfurase
MGEACRIIQDEQSREAARLAPLRDRLETAALALGGVQVNGDTARRLPHVTNLAIGGVQGKRLLTEVTRRIAVSSGSACTSALPEPSHVLLAMGLSPELAEASLRFSLGRFTTPEEVDFAIAVLREEIPRLRSAE